MKRLALLMASITYSLFFFLGLASQSIAQTTPVTYYIDCQAGLDTNTGKSTTAAWKSITKANAATLNPGDKMLFNRGCTWEGQLTADQIGTASQPILYGAYGTGEDPIIKGLSTANSSAVSITGTYLI